MDDAGGRIRRRERAGRLGRTIGSLGRDASESVVSVVRLFGKGEVRGRFEEWLTFDSVMVRDRFL